MCSVGMNPKRMSPLEHGDLPYPQGGHNRGRGHMVEAPRVAVRSSSHDHQGGTCGVTAQWDPLYNRSNLFLRRARYRSVPTDFSN